MGEMHLVVCLVGGVVFASCLIYGCILGAIVEFRLNIPLYFRLEVCSNKAFVWLTPSEPPSFNGGVVYPLLDTTASSVILLFRNRNLKLFAGPTVISPWRTVHSPAFSSSRRTLEFNRE